MIATVIPLLGEFPDRVMSRNQLRDEVRAWLNQYKDQQSCICFDFTGDWSLLLDLLDCNVPSWLTHQNIFRKIDASEKKRFWDETGFSAHHALNDARANWCAYRIGLGT